MIAAVFMLVFVFIATGVPVQAQENLRLEDVLNDIFLRFYSSDNIQQFIDSPILEVRNLIARLDLEKPTVFYTHGYTGSIKSKDVIAVVSAYLERGDHNVLAVDWSPIAGKNYPSVVRSAEAVGNALARAIDEMVDQGLRPESIHVVGHSMGAQVAGYVGRETSFELTRITGLDPAGPFFNFLEPHLVASDARFVVTIHTDSGFYGISRASGTVSFYPNGGRRVQPGCPTSYELSSPEEYCSHHRSWVFYAESLRNEKAFLGTNCTSYRSFSSGTCNENVKIPMGYVTPSDTSGVFYLTTRHESPFGMQMEGALSTKRDSNNEVKYQTKSKTNF